MTASLDPTFHGVMLIPSLSTPGIAASRLLHSHSRQYEQKSIDLHIQFLWYGETAVLSFNPTHPLSSEELVRIASGESETECIVAFDRATKRRFKQEHYERTYLREGIWRYMPEARPEGWETVPLLSAGLSEREMLDIHSKFQFPIRIPGVRGQVLGAFSGLSNIYSLGYQASKLSRFRVRQAAGETVSEDHFNVVIQATYATQRMRRALRQILVIGRKVLDVASEMSLPPQNLERRATRLRKRINEQFPSRWEEKDSPKELRLQRYQWEKGTLAHRNDPDDTGHGYEEEDDLKEW